MIILVADTSVLIDLERGNLLDIAMTGPDTLATPDFLYERELERDIGPRLIALGLEILELDSEELSAVQELHAARRGLSLADCSAYVGSRRPDHQLLSGDGALRAHAAATAVPCHGVLWLMDRLLDTGHATTPILHAGLTAISTHPRCRLPRDEIQRRLRRWRV